MSLICLRASATVTITAATGGTGISADKAASSLATPAYTTLGTIKIASTTANNDFTVGGGTITLNAPSASWQFNTSATGLVAGLGNITIISAIFTSATQLQISYTNTAVSTANGITITGLPVQGAVRTPIAAANMTVISSSVVGITSATSVGSLSQVVGAFAKLQLLLPGETASAGSATGKTGTPSTVLAGTAISVIVNSVDANWNIIVTSDNVGITDLTASDPNAILPGNSNLVNGVKTFSFTARTPGSTNKITATDATDGTKTASTSPTFTVTVGTYASLLVLLPGETYVPSSATGKSGTATAPTAGTAYSFNVYAVDAAFNTVTSITESVAITSSDVNAALPSSAALVSGTKAFSITFKTAASKTITATGSKTGTSSAVTVAPGAFAKLQVLLTGETASAGSATGKIGTPTAITAGASTTATVNAVDANWNKVSSTDVVAVTSTDAGATITTAGALSAGVKTFTVTLRTPGTTTMVTATDNTDGTKTANTSAPITVNIGTFANLLTVLPGETFAPGTSTGKTGTPSIPVAGTAFNFNVYAVDAANNVITSISDAITISTTDLNATVPATAAMAAGAVTFNFTFKTAGSYKITATDNVPLPVKTISTASLAVIPGLFVKLLLIMPGETAAPGTATGKTGTPTDRASGTAFNVIVNAVDANWNRISAVTTVNPTAVADVINIISNDAAVASPVSTGTMATGTKTISVTLKTPTTAGSLQAVDNTNSGITAYTSPNFNVTVGTFAKLQILMPGEVAAPNTTTGKTTALPTGQTAGTPFTVTVNAVDKNWNIINTANDVVGLTSTDANATNPATAALVSGTQTFTYTFKTSGTRKVTASDITNTARTANTSPNITVAFGAFVKLLAIVPGETAKPGTATGKSGTPTVQAAGKAFNVTVYAVDANWNRVTTVTDLVTLTSTDAAATMPASVALVTGGKAIAVTLKTIGTATVTATDADITKTPYTTSTITVNSGVFAKLLLLMPGESSAPGTTTGKSGPATTPQTAGTPFNVTVYAVDAAWNILTTPTDVISITSTSDINAALPANTALVAGTKTLSVTFKTAGTNRNVVAKDVTDGTKTSNTGALVTVVAGAFAQFQILLPGETAKPGTSDGKSGAANPPARGTAFNIVVNAVDANYNIINTITNTVTMTSSDGGATLPAPTALVAGTKTLNVKIVSTSTSPLPTLTATTTGPAISNTVPVPVSVPPTVATDFFRTALSGDWTDASIWESSTTGTGGWQNATLVPGTSAGGVEIRNGFVANIPAGTVNANKIVVDNGGQITVVGTLAIGTGGADIHGVVTNAGVITSTASTLKFESDGDYQHNFTTTAGTIPAATWDPNSTCEVIGYTSYAGTLAGGGQAFGNFIWNCPNQNITGGVALGGTITTSMNSLNVVSTGSGASTFQIVTGTSLTANVTVKNFTQTGGNLLLSNTSTATANLNVTGDFNVSGGTMKTTGLNTIAFAGTTTQNFIKTGGVFSTAVNFAINSGAIVDFDVNVLDGSTGTFTLNNGGTLITGNDDGISSSGATGSIQSTGTRNFGTAANFIYNGTASPQNAGTGLPATINNITINNSGNVLLPAATLTYTLNGALTLTSGNLDMNTNMLAIGGGFTTVGTGFIRTAAASTAIPSGKTWALGIEYYTSTAQDVIAGTYSNLSFSSPGTKTVKGAITVTGNWSSSDGKVDFVTTPAAAQFNGTNQTLDDDDSDSGNGVVFSNVTFGNSGTKTMNSGTYGIAPTGLLTMSGSAVLAANENLTILSDATGTGNVGPLTPGTITGNVNVQTFFTGGGDISNRGYRLVSSAISDPATPNTNFNLSFLQGQGSFLTGASGGGFDATGNPTLYLYREDQTPSTTSFTAGTFRAITAINNSPLYNVATIDGNVNLGVGNGVMYFFRGNNTTVSSNTPNDVTSSATGLLNQGQITVSPWFTGGSNLSYTAASGSSDPRFGNVGYNLVGNPYACSIDWNTLNSTTTTTGIYAPGGTLDQTIYIYNPQAKNYATYGAGTGTLGATNVIPSGQGFFVRALSASAQLIFNESAKINSHPSTLMLNSASPALASMQMHLQLSKDSVNKDENAFVFNTAAHAEYSVNEDALYLPGSGAVSLSNLSADNKRLAINQLPLPKQKQLIPLRIAVNAAGDYKFTVNQMTNIPNVYDILLVDSYKRDSLDLKANKTYTFAVSSDTASTGANRFKLLIRPDAALAVHLLSFAAVKGNAEVKINWTVENEANYTGYVLERSVDGGKTFSVLDSLTSASLGTYNDLDPHPATGQNMYRLKQTDLLGNVTYSNVITIIYSLPGSSAIVSSRISLYPNPTANTLNVSLKASNNTTVSGNFKITVTNSSGIVVKSATSAQATWQGDVSGLTPGTYFIQVINTKDNSLTGSSTFVKL